MSESSREGDAHLDVALTARWQRGAQRAASEIVERHAQALARFASTQGVRDGVQELVQDHVQHGGLAIAAAHQRLLDHSPNLRLLELS